MIIVYILLGLSLLLNFWCIWGVLENTHSIAVIMMDMKLKNESKSKIKNLDTEIDKIIDENSN